MSFFPILIEMWASLSQICLRLSGFVRMFGFVSRLSRYSPTGTFIMIGQKHSMPLVFDTRDDGEEDQALASLLRSKKRIPQFSLHGIEVSYLAHMSLPCNQVWATEVLFKVWNKKESTVAVRRVSAGNRSVREGERGEGWGVGREGEPISPSASAPTSPMAIDIGTLPTAPNSTAPGQACDVCSNVTADTFDEEKGLSLVGSSGNGASCVQSSSERSIYPPANQKECNDAGDGRDAGYSLIQPARHGAISPSSAAAPRKILGGYNSSAEASPTTSTNIFVIENMNLDATQTSLYLALRGESMALSESSLGEQVEEGSTPGLYDQAAGRSDETVV